MTGETRCRRATGETQSRRELLQTVGAAAVGAGAVATAGAGTARAAANFEVTITEAPDEMVAGETASVTAEIENTGDEQDRQTVRVNIGRDRTRVSLGPNSSTSVTLQVRTSTRDAGNQLLEVSSEDDDDGVRVDILEPPFLVGEVVETNEPVVEGRDVEVTIAVTNTGEARGSATIQWEAKEKGTFAQTIAEDNTGVSVDGGQTSTQSISFETEAEGERVIAITFAGLDEPTRAEVQVIEELPPTFEVDIVEVGEANTGDDVDVTVDVTNVGHSEGTKVVTLDLGEAGSTTTEVTAGEAKTVTETVSIPTTYGTSGTHTLTVRTENDEATTEVELGENSFFEISQLEHNSPIPQEFDFRFRFEVTNVGGLDGERTVSVDIEEIGSASETLTLASGESAAVSLNVGAGSAEVGTYNATIDSGSQTISEEVEVADTGFVDVTDLTVNTPVSAGADIEGTATLTNVGTSSATETFGAAVEGVGETSTTIVLEVDDTSEETFTIPTAEGDAGTHLLRVTTDSVSTTQEITITEPGAGGGSNESGTGGDGGNGGGDDGGSSGDDDDNSAVEESDDGAPGFGVGTAIASLGGVGYLLKRRLTGDDE